MADTCFFQFCMNFLLNLLQTRSTYTVTQRNRGTYTVTQRPILGGRGGVQAKGGNTQQKPVKILFFAIWGGGAGAGVGFGGRGLLTFRAFEHVHYHTNALYVFLDNAHWTIDHCSV